MPAYKVLSVTSQAVLVGMAISLSPVESLALEWSAQPSISAGTNVNDNINYEADPQDAVWGTTISPQLILNVSSPRASMSGVAKIYRRDYSTESALSRTDGSLNLTLTRQYERAQLSLSGNLTRDSTLESELLETGVVVTNARTVQRTSQTLAPSWGYSITEHDVIFLSYSQNDVSYSDKASISRLLDYTVKDPSITLSHTFTEKNKLTFSLGNSDYQSVTPLSSTTSQYRYSTTSAQLGFSRDFSETLNASLMAGVHKTDSTVNYLGCLPIFLPLCYPVLPTEANSSNTGSLLTASLQQKFESSQLTAELSRSLQPTAEGGLVQTDRLSGSYGAKLTPTISSSLNMSIYKTQSDEVSRVSNNGRYYSITPAVSWQITQWWSANTSYTRSATQDANGTEATGNAIDLTINYNWPTISRSR